MISRFFSQTSFSKLTLFLPDITSGPEVQQIFKIGIVWKPEISLLDAGLLKLLKLITFFDFQMFQIFFVNFFKKKKFQFDEFQ